MKLMWNVRNVMTGTTYMKEKIMKVVVFMVNVGRVMDMAHTLIRKNKGVRVAMMTTITVKTKIIIKRDGGIF